MVIGLYMLKVLLIVLFISVKIQDSALVDHDMFLLLLDFFFLLIVTNM